MRILRLFLREQTAQDIVVSPEVEKIAHTRRVEMDSLFMDGVKAVELERYNFV